MNKSKIFLKPEDVKLSLSNTPQITFEITDACNLNCTYCGYGELYSDHDARENKMLSEKTAIRLLEYLGDLWKSTLNTSFHKNVYISFYGGEPLINMPFICTVVDFIENKLNCNTRSFIFSMTTNGVLLHKYIDFLVEHKFNLLISLDGNEENNMYRLDKNKNSSFKLITKNIENIQEKYPDYFKKNVNFNAVLHNKNSVESIYHFFKNKYSKTPSIGELNNTGIRDEKKNEFWQMYKNSTNSLFQSEHYSEIEKNMFMDSATYRSAALYLMQYSEYSFKDYNELLYGKSKLKNSIPSGTCLPFSKKIFVTVNGKLLPCERIGHQFTLGKVTDSEVELDFEAIAKRYNEYYAKIKTQCKSCHNRKACIQCLFNLDDIEKDKVLCHGFMTKREFDLYQNTQMNFLRRHPEDYYKIMKEIVIL